MPMRPSYSFSLRVSQNGRSPSEVGNPLRSAQYYLLCIGTSGGDIYLYYRVTLKLSCITLLIDIVAFRNN